MTKEALPNIIISHLGYFCNSEKVCLVNKETLINPALKTFQLQCLENNYPDPNSEAWEVVKVMEAESVDCPFGSYFVGDFSSVTRPGCYRVVAQMEEQQTTMEGKRSTPGPADYSYPFLIHDEAFALLPEAFLEYLRAQRCGEAVSGYHGPCHLDDGIRSDNGQYIDTSGGWHDAGDCRKWMAYTPLPIRGLHRLKTEYHDQQHNRGKDARWGKVDAVTGEVLHGLKFILKMQDPETGMIYEDVGGGKVIDSNKPWWFENFSGCAASNQDNRFTDNIKTSGDERTVRIQYNPMVQWTNITLLAEGACIIKDLFPDIAEKVIKAAVKCFDFMNRKKPGELKPKSLEIPDDIENRTIVLGWKVSALTSLARIDSRFYDQYIGSLENAVSELLARQNNESSVSEKSIFGFWYDSSERKEPFRAVVNAAQPVIALLDFIEAFPGHKLSEAAKTAVINYFDHYILPISTLSPFAVVPYGLYFRKRSEQQNKEGSSDVFHRYNEEYNFRFFMPADTVHNMNIGMNSHLASHMHSLALAGKVFNNKKYLQLAVRQLEWICGANPFNTCLIYGFGFGNPVPHSRFLGALRGGIYNGYAGNISDRPVLDLAGKMDWGTTEFWSPPLAGIMAALAYLLPESVKSENRIGMRK